MSNFSAAFCFVCLSHQTNVKLTLFFFLYPTHSFLVRALDMFLAESGNQLPLSGAIPDLTATTEQYVLLQQAYHSKARADLDRFTHILHGVLQVGAYLISNTPLAV